MICALKEDVTATRKGTVLTCTLLNRSFDKEKKFTMPKAGELILSELYSSEDVVPNTRFSISELQVKEGEHSLEVVLPEHSVAMLKIQLPENGMTELR